MQSEVDDTEAPGWDAISAALATLYPDRQSQHFGTALPAAFGGQDPLNGFDVYKRDEPVPHWHYVSYGFSELFEKESDDPACSGYGFELTFRLVDTSEAASPPVWPMNFLQNIARYVFKTGNVFDEGHCMTANGPIALERETKLCSMGFASDPELPAMNTPNGHVKFLQVVGLTEDEHAAAKRWKTMQLLHVLRPYMPLWVTDLDRNSLMAIPAVSDAVNEALGREGSSHGLLYTETLFVEKQQRLFRQPIIQVTVGASQVEEIVTLLPLRLPFQQPYVVQGPNWRVTFEAADENSVVLEQAELIVRMTVDTAREFAKMLRAQEGIYRLAGMDGLCWKVKKTLIKDGQGKIVREIG